MSVTQASPRIRLLLADEPSLWRDGLRLILSSEFDFEVVDGEPADSVLTQILQRKTDVVVCDSQRAAEILPEIVALRLRGLKVQLIVLNLSNSPDEVPVKVRTEAAAIIAKQSDAETLLGIVRQTAKSAPARSWGMRPAMPKGKLELLSTRERQLATLVGLGFKNRDIADHLYISEQTVKNHLRNIFLKTGIKDRIQLALSVVHQRLYT